MTRTQALRMANANKARKERETVLRECETCGLLWPVERVGAQTDAQSGETRLVRLPTEWRL